MYSLTIEDSNGEIAEQFSFDHGSYLIGRQQACDILLPSSSVSRRHAELYVERGRCYIEDLDSANGIRVDGERVIDRQHLGTASQIRIGDYYLYLEFREDERMSGQDVRKTVFISGDRNHHKLVRLTGELAGEEFPLSEIENTIGRTDDNFIMLSEPSVSREHAMITRDGEDYRLVDLGSSNGTRVDGEEVLEPAQLQPGDRVIFGDVEFLFVPGDREVDPAQVRESTSSGPGTMLLASSVAVLLLLGLALGATIVYSFVWMKQNEGGSAAAAQETPRIERRLQSILDRGRKQLSQQKWDRAIATFDEALALTPENDGAQRLRERAREEKEGENLFERAMELTEEGQHRRALTLFYKIPDDTVAAENAKSTVKSVEKTVAFKLRRRAEELASRGDVENLERAREKLEQSLSLAPEKEPTRRLAKSLQERLDDAGADYEPLLDD